MIVVFSYCNKCIHELGHFRNIYVYMLRIRTFEIIFVFQIVAKMYFFYLMFIQKHYGFNVIQ